MQWKPLPYILAFFLILTIACPAIQADDNVTFDYYGPDNVIDHQGDFWVLKEAPPGGIVASGGAEGTSTFWELPLSMQLAILPGLLTGFLIAIIGILKLGPLVLGKLKKLLENQTRDKIYDSVKKNPGSTMADITRRESLNLGTVRYHINQLQASHKITFVHSNKFLRIFQNSHTYSDREKTIISALNRPSARSILMYLDSNPGSVNTHIAEYLKISESGTHVQLKKLLKEGIISSSQEGRSQKYSLTDDVKEYLLKQSSS